MNNTKDAMYCRLCAKLKQHNRLTNLQTDEETCQKVVNKLSRFNIVMDFQENILPKTVCLICVKSLERAFAFVTAVEQAQEFLSDFIMVQINTVASDSSAENMLYEPPNNEHCIDVCKYEHIEDSMEIIDDGTNISEECDSEVMTEVCDDSDCSVINGNTEENIIENKHDILPSNEIIEENMNVKDKCVELPDLFHVEDDVNILKGILLNSTVCYADYINKLNNCNGNKYEPPNNENGIVGCKDQHIEDSMEIIDDGTNISEKCDSEVMTEVCDDSDCSVINGNTEEHNIIENKHDILPSNEIIEENMNVKDKCVELPDLFHVEDDVNILKEKELNSEGILLDSTVCSADYINKQNDYNENKYEPPDNENGIVGCKDQHSHDSMEVNDDCTNLSEKNSIVDAENIDKGLQQLQPPHEEHNSKRIPPKQLASTVHSKTNINKIPKTKKNKQNNSKPSAKNTDSDVEHVKLTWKDYEWKCYYCETLFPSIEELQQHSMQYHNSCNPYQCTDCVRRSFVLKKFLKHVSKHKNFLRYSCYRCFKKFPKIYESGHHIKKVHTDSDYVCSGCNTPFYSKRELKEHLKKYNKKLFRKPPFDLTCTICNKNNETAKDLQKHLLTHKNKKYVCETCGKCFASKAEFERHIVVHGIIKILHRCDICNATFSRASRLKCHESIHTGIKPFTCDNCGKSFRTKELIGGHMKTHMDSVLRPCTQCNKKFSTAGRLKQHMFQHTGEKPFSCNMCPKVFTNSGNRNKHMRRIHDIEMVRKKRPIIKQQSVDDPTSSDLPIGEPKFADLDKMNKCKNKIIEHRRSQRAKNKNKKKESD